MVQPTWRGFMKWCNPGKHGGQVTTCGVRALFLPVGSQGLNSRNQVCQQAPFLAEPSCQAWIRSFKAHENRALLTDSFKLHWIKWSFQKLACVRGREMESSGGAGLLRLNPSRILFLSIRTELSVIPLCKDHAGKAHTRQTDKMILPTLRGNILFGPLTVGGGSVDHFLRRCLSLEHAPYSLFTLYRDCNRLPGRNERHLFPSLWFSDDWNNEHQEIRISMLGEEKIGTSQRGTCLLVGDFTQFWHLVRTPCGRDWAEIRMG